MSVPKPDSDEEYISKLGALTPGAHVDLKKIAEMLGVSEAVVKEAKGRVKTIKHESDDAYRGRIIEAVFSPLSKPKRKASVVAAKRYVKKIAIDTIGVFVARVDSGVAGFGKLCDQYKKANKKGKKPVGEAILIQQTSLQKAVGNWYEKAVKADAMPQIEKLRAWHATLEDKVKLLDTTLRPKVTIDTDFENFERKLASTKHLSLGSGSAQRVEYADMIGDIDGYQYSVGGIGSVGTSARGVVGYYDPYYANNGSQIESVMLFATVAVLFIVLMCAFCIASAVFGFIMGFIAKKRNERKGAESEVFSDEMRV